MRKKCKKKSYGKNALIAILCGVAALLAGTAVLAGHLLHRRKRREEVEEPFNVELEETLAEAGAEEEKE